ncbi:hypothetical protein FPI77_28745 [Klebsiella quasivariicola]|nr:hypothetical protein FPI77_28745 [Klebsiella quasivariicola]
MFAGKKSAQIREILISESAWEEMTCLFAPSTGSFARNLIYSTKPTADRNRSHWSTSKTPSYTKSVSWHHYRKVCSKIQT